MQRFTLKLSLALCLLGQLFLAFSYGTTINGFQFLLLDFSDSFATSIDMLLCLGVAIATIALLFYSNFKYAAYFISAWFITLGITKTVLHGSFGWEVATLAYGARYMLPLVIYFYAINQKEKAIRLAQFGIALTFVGHGIEAMMLHPGFLDYMYDFSEVYLGIIPTQNIVETTLFFIGMLDILVGFAVIFNRNKYLLWWLAFWGILTAGSRLTYHGMEGWYEFILRSPHYLLPIFLYQTRRYRLTSFKFLKAKDQVPCQSLSAEQS
ncbi:MAG: hypothetical protein GY909_04815 [Oligoflexia bacterium]|nr:hypothetical protein [Oligoflexia bacterium]